MTKGILTPEDAFLLRPEPDRNSLRAASPPVERLWGEGGGFGRGEGPFLEKGPLPPPQTPPPSPPRLSTGGEAARRESPYPQHEKRRNGLLKKKKRR